MMDPMLSAWLQFAVTVVLIGLSGTALSRFGDVIAVRTGLGGTWIGVILIATVTSFPELITGVSSVTLANDADIAVGTILGSCVFNMFILVVLDFLTRERSVFELAGQNHILSAGWGVLLVGVVGFGVLLGKDPSFPTPLVFVGVYSPIIVLLYFNAVRVVFLHESDLNHGTPLPEPEPGEMALRHAVIGYVLTSLVVVGVSLWLPFVGQHLADSMGWSHTFVGTLFVGAVTSLPEVVVTIAAIRIGAVDMAVANLFGSNMFNVLVIAVDDLFYVDGPILSHVGSVHALSAFSATMMTGVAIIGLLYRPRGRVLGLVGWASLFLVTIYMLNTYVLYLYGG